MEWISIDGSGSANVVSKEVLQSDASSYRVKVIIHGLCDQLVDNESGSFHKLSLDINSRLTSIGDPALPVFSQFLAIPEGTIMDVKIQEKKWSDMEIGTIYPAQLLKGEDTKSDSFSFNTNTYTSDFIPQLVQVGEEMEWRGIRCASLSVCPFKYFPQENRLSVLNEFIIQVNFVKDESVVTKKTVYEGADPLHLFDNNIFSNAPSMRYAQTNYGLNAYAPHSKLLIVVGKGLDYIRTSDKMDEFCKWKVFKGYPVSVVSTATTGATPDSIKSYILQKYNNDNVRYVLFVGDIDQIPMKTLPCLYNNFYTGYVSGDYWYGCMGGENDYLADVAIGRFCTNSFYDFCHMVDKSISYERSYQSQNNVLLMAHYERANEIPSYQYCSETIRTRSYSSPMTFITAYGALTQYGGDSATNSDVLGYINQGVHIVNYRGHASENYWGNVTWDGSGWNMADELFQSTEISNMSANTNAVFFSIACNSGNIAYNGECMLETFTRSSHGAVAFLGATKETGFDINNEYDESLFIKLLNDSVFQIGDLNVAAHARCISVGGNYPLPAIDNAQSYILGGDPTLELWTAVPSSFGNVNLNIANNTCTLTTNVYDGFNMCVIEDSYHHRLNQNSSTNTCTFLKPYFNFYTLLNKHNYFPYIIYCDVSTNTIVYLSNNF